MPKALALWVSGEVPPHLFRGPNGPQGYAYELFQRVTHQAGLEAELQFFPWARASLMVRAGQAAAALVVTRTPERESQFRWLFPVGNFRFAIATRAEEGPMLRELDALKGRRVGALRASASRAVLAGAGLEMVVEGKDYAELMTLLQRGIVDVVFGPETVMRTLGSIENVASEGVSSTVLDLRRDLYAGAGPAMPDGTAQRIVAAYRHLVDSGFVAQLKKRHPDAFYDD